MTIGVLSLANRGYHLEANNILVEADGSQPQRDVSCGLMAATMKPRFRGTQ